MKTILRFLKPYRWLRFFTILVMLLDVMGALLIPTLLGDIINNGVESGDMAYVLEKSALMLLAALASGSGSPS